MGNQMDLFGDIKEFHEKFDLKPLEKPGLLCSSLMRFRVQFIEEELDELRSAYFNDDLEEVFDALIDIVYVTLGTAYLMNLPFNEGWKEVQSCNMKKIKAKYASESKRHSSHDVIKPDDWQSPNLKKLLTNI
jgi:predicted HAD superfamily Cof-like phosphohydrolase